MTILKLKQIIFYIFLFLKISNCFAINIEEYNIIWKNPSKNSSESMPCGGGEIGLNVWVENGDILFYIAQSGFFDENNGMLKHGRIRITYSPNPFIDYNEFRQILQIKEGCVVIIGKKSNLNIKTKIQVDVFNPIITITTESNYPIQIKLCYENWRYVNRLQIGRETDNNRSFVGAPIKAMIRKDSVYFFNNKIISFHRNDDLEPNALNLCIKQQKLLSIKDSLFNPLKNLINGCLIEGKDLFLDTIIYGKYASTPFKAWLLKTKKDIQSTFIQITLNKQYTDNLQEWIKTITDIHENYKINLFANIKRTNKWWEEFWNKSFVYIYPNKNDSQIWEIGRNYQLFRYMLGCNYYGSYPTKFNGGLFTFDPEYIDEKFTYTPDYRKWGGGSFTAQNQRLVYWPMLKSGDFDAMLSQFKFYLQILKNAELRTQQYWGHKGASFTEQMENFGLPVAFEYGWKRPENFDPGVEYNSWIEYQWDTALEFCFMILQYYKYTSKDIKEFIPLIESCLIFFDEHYQYLSSLRTTKKLDENGYLVLYPATACETYKMATNPVTTICALRSVIQQLLQLPENFINNDKKTYYREFLNRIPPIPFRIKNGMKTIAPAERYERINNIEIPQLYPVFPYEFYGLGKPDIEVAINTWKYGIDRPEQKNYISWHQDGIFCARLGLIDEAKQITMKKFKNGNFRFPVFWGPGHDWVPDHNWGSSAMIGLQEMLLQTKDSIIYLLPAWPENWNVHFKLHAPYNTLIECVYNNKKIEKLIVLPKNRKKDVIICTKRVKKNLRKM